MIDQETVLHTNRAFACIKLTRWKEAEDDCSSSLNISPANVKARYRRALARIELEKFKEALEDIDAALLLQGDNAELKALREKTAARLKPNTKSAAAPPEIKETSSSPSSSPTTSPTSRKSPTSTNLGPAARAAAAVKTAAPNVPKQSPKNSVEMLRNFHSMSKYPEVLATYVRERVPPSLVASMFKRSPIEPDDLATLVAAIKLSVDGEAHLQQDTVQEYLQALLKTHSADIQMGMLSDSEKQVVKDLLSLLPQSESSTKSLQASYRKILA